ncbi:CPXCG motif-containing cysteine-rich protein [Kangiella japonica]|uniref:CPXCG motif-containing cysteine-rich protein n=1 Tax=Kangiella japonica TaxID=647384 RepID=A0ABN0SVL9_9GAMM
MNQLIEKDISCPYCGETITVLIDDSVPHQEYIEDCQVCCRPIEFVVSVMDREVKVEISTDR